MAKNYDGWVVKYSWGRIATHTFREKRTDVIKGWNKHALGEWGDNSLTWKNMSRRCGHKIVKVKLVEVSDEKTE